MAFRRFRTGLLRLRSQLGESPDAAPVRAELDRLARRRRESLEPASRGPSTLKLPPVRQSRVPEAPTMPERSDPQVQRRCLCQLVMDKTANCK